MSDTTGTAASNEEDSLAEAHSKALAINLSNAVYGTFAEIGAGQEVARWFLRVGGASGTVAQTVSAYDKTFSDQTYGTGTRYVSRERLLAMLDHEFELLRSRLGTARGGTTTFFAFADTIAARNFKGDNEQHGWMGIRFQTTPLGETNDILLHVNLMDPTADRQQESLGILGVNLIFAAFRQRESSDTLFAGIFERLTLHQFEVDVVEVRGPAFAGRSSEQWSLDALCRGMAHAVVFDAAGHVTEPSTVLRKRPLIVVRGHFHTVEPFNLKMLEAGQQYVKSEGVQLNNKPCAFGETTVRHPDGTSMTPSDELLKRVQRMQILGPVVVTDFPQTYLLVNYLRRYTTEPIRLVIGVSALAHYFGHEHYKQLPGSILEGIGRLLAKNVRILVFPMPRAEYQAALGTMSATLEPLPADLEFVTAADIHPKPPISFLYDYIRAAGWIADLQNGSGKTETQAVPNK